MRVQLGEQLVVVGSFEGEVSRTPSQMKIRSNDSELKVESDEGW